jgi:hypothetical protein
MALDRLSPLGICENLFPAWRTSRHAILRKSKQLTLRAFQFYAPRAIRIVILNLIDSIVDGIKTHEMGVQRDLPPIFVHVRIRQVPATPCPV